jgi:hypothetical protein
MVAADSQRRLAVLVLLTLLAMTFVGRSAATGSIHRREPSLTVSQRQLSRALSCHGRLHRATRAPILLVPGTTLDPVVNYSWNYERAFSHRHWPWCAVTLPHESMGDTQIAAQYIVHAIRRMHRSSRRPVDLLGYSQGGMLPRWALKYWPRLRADVNDYVAIDPSNHGSLDAAADCLAVCAPAIWQQRPNSAFLSALNRGPETWHGIDYTVIYSRADEVVVPNFSARGSSALHTGHGRIRNIAVQRLCPLDLSDHLAMGTYDPVAYALAVDAFTHRGPAKPARVPAATCSQVLMSGVVPSAFPSEYASYAAHAVAVLATARQTSAEPPLAEYAR